MKNSYLGSFIKNEEIETKLFEKNLNFVKFENFVDICEKFQMSINSLIIGWCQGRSEFGPRALGHRSILADPRTGYAKKFKFKNKI